MPTRARETSEEEPEEPRRRASRRESTQESRGGEATPRRRSAETASTTSSSSAPRRADRPRRPTLGASKAAGLAARQVSELTNRDPESVTSIQRLDSGWRVGVEVVESRRIPDSTDILAVYEAELDGEGELVSYRRSERYHRGRAQED